MLQRQNKLFMSYMPVQLTACLPPVELKHVFQISQGLTLDTISALRPAVSHSNLCSLSMQFTFIGHCEWLIYESCEKTSYLFRFIPPLRLLLVLLMALLRYIIYVTTSDITSPDQNPVLCFRLCLSASSSLFVSLGPYIYPPPPPTPLPPPRSTPLAYKDAWRLSALDSNNFNIQK